MGDANVCLSCSATSLEAEGLGDDTDCQSADGLGNFCDDGSSTGSGSAALACCDEDHVSPGQGFFNFFCVIFSSLAADLWVGSGAQAAGEFATDVKLDVCLAEQQRLRICIDSNELDALEPELNHAIHGINTTTADTDNFDDGKVVLIH